MQGWERLVYEMSICTKTMVKEKKERKGLVNNPFMDQDCVRCGSQGRCCYAGKIYCSNCWREYNGQ